MLCQYALKMCAGRPLYRLVLKVASASAQPYKYISLLGCTSESRKGVKLKLNDKKELIKLRSRLLIMVVSTSYCSFDLYALVRCRVPENIEFLCYVTSFWSTPAALR